MKIFISGNSGLGKSTVMNELAHRGFAAIDGDEEPGLARFELKATGKPVSWPKGFVDWSKYSWNLQADKLQEVLGRSDDVFIGGIYNNQTDFYRIFDKLLVLAVSREEHARRLASRKPREFGDGPQNNEERLNKQLAIRQRMLDAGATEIDASGTPAQTADRILEATIYAGK